MQVFLAGIWLFVRRDDHFHVTVGVVRARELLLRACLVWLSRIC